jgi:superfamily II DNA or RNA helicase
MPIIALLGNRKTGFKHCKDSELLLLRDHFRFHPPGYFFSPSYQNKQWDGYIRLFSRGKVATGLFLDQLEALKAKGLRFRLQEGRTRPEFQALPLKLEKLLRDYQQECVNAMVAASQTGGLILSATGSGKTYTAGAYFARLKGYGLFVVDELTLLEQSRQALATLLGRSNIGVVGHGVFQPRRITVATIQTLHRHRHNPEFRPWFEQLQAVIVDEVHLALNRQNIDVLNQISPQAVYGLTATLELKKTHIRMRATALAGPPIYSYPLQQGVQDQVLSHGMFCQVLFPQAGVYEKYQWEYRALVSNSRRRNDCVEALTREGIRRKRCVIVLVERLAHLRILSRRLHDIPHQVLCGAYSQEDRLKAKAAMDQGKLPLILANRVFAKGVDIRRVDTILDATGMKNKNSVTQRYGRGSRKAEGKHGLLYLDIGDAGLPAGKPNRFAANSRSRLRAMKALTVPTVQMPWKGNAMDIYNRALAQLEKELQYNS